MRPLTFEFRRAQVAAFWAVAMCVLFVFVGVLATMSGISIPWSGAAVVTAGFVLPGVLWRPWFETAVWAWNGMVWRLASWLRAYVLRVGYYVVLYPLQLSGLSRELTARRHERSGWVSRGTGFDERYPNRLASREGAGWLGSLHAFARVPGNRWAFCLVPMTFLLALLKDEQQDTAIPGSTYTLY